MKVRGVHSGRPRYPEHPGDNMPPPEDRGFQWDGILLEPGDIDDRAQGLLGTTNSAEGIRIFISFPAVSDGMRREIIWY